jgi:hypothetical protein
VVVVLVSMLVCLGAAVAVLALVAIPRVRDGERLLTPDGEAAVREAQRRARHVAKEARGLAVDVRERAAAATAELRSNGTGPDGNEPDGAEPAQPDQAAEPEDQLEPDDAVELRPAGSRPAVIDLRVSARPRPQPSGPHHQLEWGDPEAGPRHRR